MTITVADRFFGLNKDSAKVQTITQSENELYPYCTNPVTGKTYPRFAALSFTSARPRRSVFRQKSFHHCTVMKLPPALA